jgi:hypothetical protein
LAARSLRMRGTRIVELRLSKGLQRSLRRRHVRSFRATVRVVVTEAGGGQRRAARAVRIRL